MKPEDIDLSKGQRIAFASSQGDGRDRWTELAVYYFAAPPEPNRPWLAISRGCSSRPGETTRERRLYVRDLERALKLFDEGVDLGVIVCEQAREWDDNQSAQREFAQKVLDGFAATLGDTYEQTVVRMGYGLADDQSALAYLYGVKPDALPSVNSMATDLGMSESTLRTALKSKTPIRVPLLAIADLIDGAAFRARRARENSDG